MWQDSVGRTAVRPDVNRSAHTGGRWPDGWRCGSQRELDRATRGERLIAGFDGTLAERGCRFVALRATAMTRVLGVGRRS
eukprot:scaffold97649_cov29-Tisochrysis_lutea.AAC.2